MKNGFIAAVIFLAAVAGDAQTVDDSGLSIDVDASAPQVLSGSNVT